MFMFVFLHLMGDRQGFGSEVGRSFRLVDWLSVRFSVEVMVIEPYLDSEKNAVADVFPRKLIVL